MKRKSSECWGKLRLIVKRMSEKSYKNRNRKNRKNTPTEKKYKEEEPLETFGQEKETELH